MTTTELRRALDHSDHDIACHGCNVYYRGRKPTEVEHGKGCWTIDARAAFAQEETRA